VGNETGNSAKDSMSAHASGSQDFTCAEPPCRSQSLPKVAPSAYSHGAGLEHNAAFGSSVPPPQLSHLPDRLELVLAGELLPLRLSPRQASSLLTRCQQNRCQLSSCGLVIERGTHRGSHHAKDGGGRNDNEQSIAANLPAPSLHRERMDQARSTLTVSVMPRPPRLRCTEC
jgi:hypothetical protein